MRLPNLAIPRFVADAPERKLSVDQKHRLVQAARVAHADLARAVSAFEDALGSQAYGEPSEEALSAMSDSETLDLYDWFFLVERTEIDSDASGFRAVVQAMSGYADLIASKAIITDVEEASLVEALQAIAENYGDK
jgi:hypothetical protein